MSQAISILFGAILALASSFIIEIYKFFKGDKEKRTNIKIILRLEFKNISNIIEKLTENYGTKHYFEFKVLDQLKDSVDRLNLSRDKIIYLKEDSKKEELLSVINSVWVFHSDTRGLESYAWNKDINLDPNAHLSEFCKGERQVIALKSIDLKRQVQNVVTYLESHK